MLEFCWILFAVEFACANCLVGCFVVNWFVLLLALLVYCVLLLGCLLDLLFGCVLVLSCCLLLILVWFV